MIKYSEMVDRVIYRVSWKTRDGVWWHRNIKKVDGVLKAYSVGSGENEWVVDNALRHLLVDNEAGHNSSAFTESVNDTVFITDAGEELFVHNKMLSELYLLVNGIIENVAIDATYHYAPDATSQEVIDAANLSDKLTTREKERILELLKTYL